MGVVLTLGRIFRLLNLLQQVGGTPFSLFPLFPPPFFFVVLFLNLSGQCTSLKVILQKNCFLVFGARLLEGR